MHLFLLAGQSNMSGFGNIADVPPIIDERIFVIKKGQKEKAIEPLHQEHRFCGIGLAMTFATAYLAQYPTVNIGFIPTAFAGSNIEWWQPNHGDLFQNAIEETQKALKWGSLKGILWHQGEANAFEETVALNHAIQLKNTLYGFRAVFGDIPFVAGALGDFLAHFPELPCYQQVNQGIEGLMQKESRCAFVKATGLMDIGDNLHFNATSLRQFGKRYFEAFQSI